VRAPATPWIANSAMACWRIKRRLAAALCALGAAGLGLGTVISN